eukprot:scaffold4473_cov55-Attheya_sp.AAC.4
MEFTKVCVRAHSQCLDDGTLARWDEERTGIVEARLVLLSQYVPKYVPYGEVYCHEKVYCHLQNRLNTVRCHSSTRIFKIPVD